MDQKQLKQYNLLFEINKLYELRINSEYSDLSNDIIAEITKTVITDFIFNSEDPFKSFPIYSFIGDVDWRWMSNRGALPKRISKWFKDNLNMYLTSDTLTSIGNIARKTILKDQIYYFDFTDEICWKQGNFGDHGSCFMRENPGETTPITKAMSEDERFFAIRLFRQHNHTLIKQENSEEKNIYYSDNIHWYSGISRALICNDNVEVLRKGVKIEYPLFIVFNGYGLSTFQIAGVVTKFLGTSSKRIQIANNKKVTGGLYVNNHGIVVGAEDIISSIVSYDFGLKYQFSEKVPVGGFSKVRLDVRDGERVPGQMEFRARHIAARMAQEEGSLKSILKNWPIEPEQEENEANKKPKENLEEKEREVVGIPDGIGYRHRIDPEEIWNADEMARIQRIWLEREFRAHE